MDKPGPSPAAKGKKEYQPRPFTATRIYNSAVYYLQRYGSSVANLRHVMQRKLLRAQMRGETVPPEARNWIEQAIEKCLKFNFVNDDNFAEQKILSLQRQGRSQTFIARTLQQKGIDAVTVKKFLPQDDEADNHAARRYVQRRRLGRDLTPEGRRKDLAKLLRAGFGLKAAKAALAEIEEENF